METQLIILHLNSIPITEPNRAYLPLTYVKEISDLSKSGWKIQEIECCQTKDGAIALISVVK